MGTSNFSGREPSGIFFPRFLARSPICLLDPAPPADSSHPLSLNASDEVYRLLALAAQFETLAMRLDADYPLAVWRELEKLIARLDATSNQLFDNAIVRLQAEQEAAAS